MAKKISVGICVNDADYADALAVGLSGSFDVTVSRDNCTDADIVLSDGKFEGVNVLQLVNDKDEEGIYRFEGAKRIEKHIIYKYCSLYNDYALKTKISGCRIITVCSPYGGVGCSLVARGTAGAVAGERTLYITLDDIPYETKKTMDAIITVNRLMYIFEDRNYNMADIESCLWKDESGVSHFRYMHPYNVLSGISSEEFLVFLSKLTEFFDCIVVDAGCRLNPITASVRQLSDSIVCVHKYKERNNKKDVYMAELSKQYSGKVFHVINMAENDIEKCDCDMVVGIYDNPEREVAEYICMHHNSFFEEVTD